MMIKTTRLLAGAIMALCTLPVHAEEASPGESLYQSQCAQCHGRAGKGSGAFPSLVGREAGYISERLEKYRAGEKVGPNSALMRGPASRLSDEDIAALADYISTTFQ
ncbi:MAG: c-type cytochrome [Oleiphilaceae bacterium]|nr:c-type cytochrome [Oleiphilaceae bacterium]